MARAGQARTEQAGTGQRVQGTTAQGTTAGRRTVSIGEELAAARSQAGLTVTEVSQRTKIRETIVRGIERDDYGACGGDFYARGFIRAIARTVGADPAPFIRDYDAAHRPPHDDVSAALPRPVSAVRQGGRRRPNVTVVLAVALAVVVAFAAYQFFSGSARSPGTTGQKAQRTATGRHHAVAPEPPSPAPAASRSVVRLTAIEDCWVQFATRGGRILFQSYVVAGASKRWTFRHAVDMTLGNPGGVKLLVNGTSPLPPGTSHPITLLIGRHRTAA
jgi:transcriptional regulator with XRE-family HTH domain